MPARAEPAAGYIAPHFPYPDDNVLFTHRPLVSASKVIAPGGEQSTHRARIYQTTDNGATWSKLAGPVCRRAIIEN